MKCLLFTKILTVYFEQARKHFPSNFKYRKPYNNNLKWGQPHVAEQKIYH
jgi:hypothetical protein